MPHRQTVEFLRRRYAVAILRDDAGTASRLRAQLDGIMNHARRPERLGEAPHPKPQARPIDPPARLIQAPIRPPSVAGERACGAGVRPRLHVVMPVTGLRERPVRRPMIAASRDAG
jgi:transposase